MNRFSIRCSSLNRILKCPGSVKLETIAQETSEAAQAGTDKHNEALSGYLQGKFDTPYLTYIKRDSNDLFSGIEWIGAKHFKDFTLTGGVDFWRMDKHKVLEVIDLKTGAYPVQPTTNQIKGYALLLLNFFKSLRVKIKQVRLTIFQFDKPNSITLSADEIFEFGYYLAARLKQADIQSGYHCTFCESKLFCPIMKGKANVAQKSVGVELPENARQLLLDAPAVDKYLKELKTQYIKLHPEHVKFSSRSSKTWLDLEKAPLGPMTVAQAIKAGYDVEDNVKTVKISVAKIK